MPVALIVVAAVAVAAEVASTAEQKKASDAAANTAKQVATYNANLDAAESNQIDLDTQANIQAMRRDAATYMSRQQSTYAANGINANSGSALAVRAATAGQFAMKEQQTWADAQAKESRLASAAQAGIAEGDAAAAADHMEGIADVISGAGKVASTIGSAYAGGAGSELSAMFSGGGGGVNVSNPGNAGGATDLTLSQNPATIV